MNKAKKKLREILEMGLSELKPKEREIMKLLYGLGGGYSYSHEKVAALLDLGVARVKAIEAGCLKNLLYEK